MYKYWLTQLFEYLVSMKLFVYMYGPYNYYIYTFIHFKVPLNEVYDAHVPYTNVYKCNITHYFMHFYIQDAKLFNYYLYILKIICNVCMLCKVVLPQVFSNWSIFFLHIFIVVVTCRNQYCSFFIQCV